MSLYYRFVMSNGQTVGLHDIDASLKGVSPRYAIDGDAILFDGETCGIIEINHSGDGVMDPDIELLCGFAEKKKHRDELVRMLRDATTMITVHPVLGPSEERLQMRLLPLWDCLWGNFKGLLAVEGGGFVGRDGEIS